MDFGIGEGLAVIGLALGSAGYFKGLREYKKTQDWKKTEFIAQEVKDFFRFPVNQNALEMIYWTATSINFYPGEPDAEYEYVRRKDVIIGLTPEEDNFSEIQGAVRDTFGKFLSELSRFEHYIELGILTEDDLTPYFRPLIRYLNSDEEDISELKNALFRFIKHSDYDDVERFLNRFASVATK